jgi:hypothetical protein
MNDECFFLALAISGVAEDRQKSKGRYYENTRKTLQISPPARRRERAASASLEVPQ